jgi:hypothetical protein
MLVVDHRNQLVQVDEMRCQMVFYLYQTMGTAFLKQVGVLVDQVRNKNHCQYSYGKK